MEKTRVSGHSPFEGWAVPALLFCLSLQVTTGLFADDEIYTTGPLAGMVSSDINSWATKIHYQNSDILFGLILFHLLASAFYYFALKINLVKPMITGKSTLPGGENAQERPFTGVACLLVAISICIFF